MPVEFHDNTSYSCSSDKVFFEEDRDMGEWNLTCLEDGSWEEPVWPVCLASGNYCKPAPTPPV